MSANSEINCTEYKMQKEEQTAEVINNTRRLINVRLLHMVCILEHYPTQQRCKLQRVLDFCTKFVELSTQQQQQQVEEQK